MFLNFLFGKKSQQSQVLATPQVNAPPVQAKQAVAPAPAPGTNIRYNPDLVSQLEADHQKLLKIFTEIGNSFNAGDLSATVQYLENFRTEIQAHLLTEDVRLYIYLEHALAGNTASHALIHEFRLEMASIGKAVLAFLKKYRELAAQPSLSASFSSDLNAVGKVLVERIQREESKLYPLYMPAY